MVNPSTQNTNIANGVVTIEVATNTAEGDGPMRNAITAKINEVFGQSPNSLADHVMYCLPPNTMSGIAYAYINSWNSVYSNEWCNYVSAQMRKSTTSFFLYVVRVGTWWSLLSRDLPVIMMICK